jgi:hypothetical protein
MLHLSPERLAALADDEPTAAEARHLAGCALCARERSAYGALLVLARREGARQAPPLTDWSAISERMRSEGMISVEPTVRPAGRRAFRSSAWMRVAAALLIAAGGIAVGRYSAALPLTTYDPEGLPTAIANRGADPVATPVSYRSPTDAMEAFLRAQRELQQAAAFLAENEVSGFSSPDPDAYRARLAAFDGVVGVARAALYDAPADPMINQLYLTTVGARDATVRQIARSLPVGTTLTSY